MAFHNPIIPCIQVALLSFVLIATHSKVHAGGTDNNSTAGLTPFRLTVTPGHVVESLTQDVTIRCDHNGQTESQLGEISRIRILKKSGSNGWKLLAEMRDNEGAPKADVGVSVRARIDNNIMDTFLEITWPLATEETFGLYRCDVIGFDMDAFSNTVENAPGIELLAEKVTTGDMMAMFQETKQELGSIEVHEDLLDTNVTSLSGLIRLLTGKVNAQGSKLDSLVTTLDSLGKSVRQNSQQINDLNMNNYGNINTTTDGYTA